MENCIKLRINAGNKSTSNAQDKDIADAYRNKFIIPLDFEMLESAAPYYQAGFRNRLCYELTFNDYNRVTKSSVSLYRSDVYRLKLLRKIKNKHAIFKVKHFFSRMTSFASTHTLTQK